MTGTPQPLVDNMAIVDAKGTPTQYFIRWAQQRQIDIQGSIDAAEALTIVQQFLADHPLHAGNGIGLAPSGDIADDITITAKVQEILDQISTTRGTVLYRGNAGWAGLAPGPTDDLLATKGAGADPVWEHTAVTPGTYGDATHSARITVDQQGRVTAAANVAITGGGGGGTTPSVVQKKTVANNTGAIVLAAAPTPGNLMIAFATAWQASTVANTDAGWVLILRAGDTNPNDVVRIAAKVATAADTTAQSPFINIASGCALTLFEVTDSPSMDVYNFGFTPESNVASKTLNMGVMASNCLLIGVVNSVSTALSPTITGATAGTTVSGATTNVTPQAGTPFTATPSGKGGAAIVSTYTSAVVHYIIALVLRGA